MVLDEQVQAANGDHRRRLQRAARRAVLLATTVTLAGCGLLGPAEPPGTEKATYPQLSTVPARPSLPTTLADRQALGRDLAYDRAAAEYDAARIDYEAGRTPTPPAAKPVPPTPPASKPAAAAKAERWRGPGDNDVVEAYVKDALVRDKDDGKLKDFLRRLEEPVPGTGAVTSAAEATGVAQPKGESAASALQTFGGYLGGRLAVAQPTPPAVRGELLTRIAFAPGATALPAEAGRQLREALARAEAGGSRLLIDGGGAAAELPASRVDMVALALQRLGAPPSMLELAPGAPEDEVRVSLLRPDA